MFTNMDYWTKLVTSIHQPCDPSLLALFRICFGLFMMIDIPQERGMAYADSIYSEESQDFCRFPLIHGMEPFGQDIMVVLYAVLFLNSFFICIGFIYRLNALSFACIYWYLFILDTSVWNNHSYLYGILAVLLLVCDGNHYLSVDGMLDKHIHNAEVPHWNYILLRYQVFIVYFIAGLKKTEADWLTGYSMHKLSKNPLFDPLRLLFAEEDIDFWMIHIGGFLFDSSVGFLLYFDKTRWLALTLCGTFHGLNSQLFNIGMFPYVMFSASFLFCHPESFKLFLTKLSLLKNFIVLKRAKLSPGCISKHRDTAKNKEKITWKQNAVTLLALLYFSEQAFLPYSHFITKGYNGWTRGLYGYSWDMMVHSFKNQHIKISYKDLSTGEIGYLKPGSFLSGRKLRWTNQPKMAVQYARCIVKQLRKFGINDSAVYFDVWKSMNGRFQQRFFDPHKDIARYPWSPFMTPAFVMPLLSHLSDWREEMKKTKQILRNNTNDYDVVFVADFPGLSLENYVHSDLGNTTVKVLKGHVEIEIAGRNTSLKASKKLQIPPGEFHKVFTKDATSCYSYIYINTTAKHTREKVEEYKDVVAHAESRYSPKEDQTNEFDPWVAELYRRERDYNDRRRNRTLLGMLSKFVYRKTAVFRRSFLLVGFSIRNLLIGRPTQEDQVYQEQLYLNLWHTPRSKEPPVQVLPEIVPDSKNDEVKIEL